MLAQKRRAVLHHFSVASCLAVIACASFVQPSPAAAQSATCQFAVAGWLGARLELQQARKAYRDCLSARRTACTAEHGRVRQLEQQIRLMRNYVDGYCTR
jgi:hypothetical protein